MTAWICLIFQIELGDISMFEIHVIFELDLA
jgi:hypothetical protein